MIRVATLVAILTVSTVPSYAYDHYLIYRIHGNELQSIERVPPEQEAPDGIALSVGPDAKTVETLLIESDDTIEDCAAILSGAKGNPQNIVRIAIKDNAQTMNGVLVTECGVETVFDMPSD